MEPLSIWGFLMVASFMALVLTDKLSAFVALVLIPVLFAVLSGFGQHIGVMMMDGIKLLAPTGIMLIFAILYFGIMNDAGLFKPLINAILKFAKGDPLKLLVGTAVLALLVSLDGDGTTTYIIVITAMLPICRHLGVKPVYLGAIVMLAVGVTNIVPWGGPTARAAGALQIEPGRLFTPMIPALMACAAWVIALAAILGFQERKRLATLTISTTDLQSDGLHLSNAFSPQRVAATSTNSKFSTSANPQDGVTDGIDSIKTVSSLRDTIVFYFNLLLTITLVVLLTLGTIPMSVLFIIGCAIALPLNLPSAEQQKEQLVAHAKPILSVSSLIFAAGSFTGILSGTGMLAAMSHSILNVLSSGMASHLTLITAALSLPLSFFLSNDAFYFGILPLFSKAAAVHGLSPIEVGRAALVCQPVHLLSPLVPSTYLLVSLLDMHWRQHIRFTLLLAVLSCAIMLIAAVGSGAISL